MGNVRHFAINADDVPRARRFYQQVFGWTFEPWGPPGFFMIRTGPGDQGRPAGSLQARREIAPGRRMTGYECTIAVDDVDAVAAAVVASGGKVLMEKATIPGVGDLIWLEDPEGNIAGAMRYDGGAE
ncbi:MAG: VOC family protein [Vicinamibacterales bacterium]